MHPETTRDRYVYNTHVQNFFPISFYYYSCYFLYKCIIFFFIASSLFSLVLFFFSFLRYIMQFNAYSGQAKGQKHCNVTIVQENEKTIQNLGAILQLLYLCYIDYVERIYTHAYLLSSRHKQLCGTSIFIKSIIHVRRLKITFITLDYVKKIN